MSALAKKKKGKGAAAPPPPQPSQRPAQRPAQRASGGVPPPEAFNSVRRLPPPNLPGPNRPGPAANAGQAGRQGQGTGKAAAGRGASKARGGASPSPSAGGKAKAGKQPPPGQDAPKKPPKKRKPVNPARRRFQRRVAAALLIIGLVGGGVVLSVNLLFKIGGFELEGEVPYTVEQVAGAFGHGEGDNMYGFSAANAAERITRSLPYIESVSIRRRLPSTILFKATAAEEKYYIDWNDGYAVLSAQRKVLRLADSPPEGLVHIRGLEGLQVEPGLPLALTEDAEKQSASAASAAGAAASGSGSGSASAPGSTADASQSASAREDGPASDSGAGDVQVSAPEPPQQPEAPQGATPAECFAAMELLLDALDDAGLEDVTWVNVSDPLELRFRWEERITVKLGPRSGLEEKLRAAVVLLTDSEQAMVDPKEAGTLDMSYYLSTGRSIFSPE